MLLLPPIELQSQCLMLHLMWGGILQFVPIASSAGSLYAQASFPRAERSRLSCLSPCSSNLFMFLSMSDSYSRWHQLLCNPKTAFLGSSPAAAAAFKVVPPNNKHLTWTAWPSIFFHYTYATFPAAAAMSHFLSVFDFDAGTVPVGTYSNITRRSLPTRSIFLELSRCIPSIMYT